MVGDTFSGRVWLWSGPAAWHFVTLPRGMSGVVRKRYGSLGRAGAAVPVIATIGATSWKTSIFFDSKSSSYILPIKAAVRKKEHIAQDSRVRVTLSIAI
jgi:hypothetical protein